MTVTLQIGTAIASAWMTEEPLHMIATKMKMSGRDVMNVVRQMQLPDRHPVTRQLYQPRQMVEA